MRKLLSLALALGCLFSISACAAESESPVDAPDLVYVDYPESELYPGGDISLSVVAVNTEDSSVQLRLENNSSHEIEYGYPMFYFTRETSKGWQRHYPDYDIPAVLCFLLPGEVSENTCSALRDVDALVPGETYRVCFEFFYRTENPEADDGGNFGSIRHNYYVVHDFTVE